MRLRLLIKRNGLPATPIIWDPSSTGADARTLTIAQLLEQVNEVVPLESGEWGLEDYAVEIVGSAGTNFECLHFQPVEKVIREQDEVVIRPLLRQDLRVRRLTGRHQISADGKHLIDGLAYGRPWLKRPVGRPAVDIPPRKRARITYGEEGAESEEDEQKAIEDIVRSRSTQKLLSGAEFEDDGDEEDDEDFEPEQEEDDEDDEVEEGEEEGDGEGAEDAVMEDGDEPQLLIEAAAMEEPDVEEDPELLEIVDEGVRSKVKSLHEQFSKAPISVCKNILLACNGNSSAAKNALTLGFEPAKAHKHSRSSPKTVSPAPPPNTRRSSRSQSKPALHADAGRDLGGQDDEESHSEHDDPLLDYYDHRGLPAGSIGSGEALAHMAKAVKTRFEGESGVISRPSSRLHRTASISSNKSVRFADTGDNEPADGRSDLDDDDSEDGDFRGESSNDSSSGSSGDEDELDEASVVVRAEAGTVSVSSDSSSSTDSSSESDSESDSSSESSSGSEVSSSSSDSDSEPEVASSKTGNVISRPSLPLETTKAKPKQQQTAPPGKGKKATHARNQRRRQTEKLKRLQESGIVPASITLTEFKKLELDQEASAEDAQRALTELRMANEAQKVKNMADKSVDKAAEFEARRQALLASLADGGIEVDDERVVPVKSKRSAKKSTSKQITADAEVSETQSVQVDSEGPQSASTQRNPDIPMPDVTSTITQPLGAAVPSLSTPAKTIDLVADSSLGVAPRSDGKTATPDTQAEPTSESSTTRRRAKLDLGAGRRLLFGALGIKTPKTKTDEEKVRSDLMKYVRPAKTAKALEEEVAEAAKQRETITEDPDAWREKITLRGVECCYDGVELSDPPFPFVQRWDPQQRSSGRKGKRKGKKNRDQHQPQQYSDDQTEDHKRKRYQPKEYDEDEQYYNAEEQTEGEQIADLSNIDTQEEVDYENRNTRPHSGRDDSDSAVTEQIMRDTNGISTSAGTEEDDLPVLPEDMSTLSDLTQEDAKVGAVVAFKQLEMSQMTNWQPQVSAYRTAVIINVSADVMLELTLAKRDRTQSDKLYDEETGERIYGRFEMPAEEDDEDAFEEDDGFMSLSFSELVEPKIVQAAPAISERGDSVVENSERKPDGDTDESRTLDHPEEQSRKNSANSSAASEAPAGQDANASGPLPNDSRTSDEPSFQGGQPGDQNPVVDASITEEARHDISMLMKDAGFRSSVPSSILPQNHLAPETPSPAAALQQLLRDMTATESQDKPYSPRFQGLDMSTPIKAIADLGLMLTPSDIGSPSHTPSFARPASRSGDIIEDESIQSIIRYPQIEGPSSTNSQVTDHGRQPESAMEGDDTLDRLDNSVFLGDNDVEMNESEISLPTNPDRPLNHVSMQGLVTSTNDALDMEAAFSDSSLPSLEEVFSTARSSLEFKREKSTPHPLHNIAEDTAYEKAMAALDAEDQITPRASRRQFVMLSGSQMVDLTGTSDAEPEQSPEPVVAPVINDKLSGGDHDESYGLPKGPGWIEKRPKRGVSEGVLAGMLGGSKGRRRTSQASSKASSQPEGKGKRGRRKTTSRL